MTKKSGPSYNEAELRPEKTSGQPSQFASLKTPAIAVGFEAAQILLQRAGEQLRLPDPAQDRHKAVVAAFLDQFLLDSIQRSINFDMPIDKLRREFELMDIKRLVKIVDKLTLTPVSVAVRYLTWVHASLGSEEPNPLDGWLRELENSIHLHHIHDRPYHLFRAAERQLFTWVGLYVAALLGWIEEFCETVPLVEIAAAHVRFGLFRPELGRHLLERCDRLLEWAAVIDIIEQDYLQASVLPDAWRRWLDPGELNFAIAKNLERSGKPAVRRAGDSAECKERARAKVAALLETARATADVAGCHWLIFSLTQAQLMLINRRNAWKEFSALLESQEAEHGLRKRSKSS